MKLIRKFNQYRRDLDCELECEGCQAKAIVRGAYDDRNYWDNVLPSFSCQVCGKSTNNLSMKPEYVATRYADNEIV